MTVFSIPVDFILFALTLLGVAIFHHKTLHVALTGLAVIVIYKFAVTGFPQGPAAVGFLQHMAHEAPILSNLFLLLTGFAVLARHFEDSKVPDALPSVLPDTWIGGLALLALIFVLSAFLDNIAAALIGGTAARHVFKNRVHIGYLAAIVAASNAGGSGSVLGDTTTTMMWIGGISPFAVDHAYAAAVPAFFVFAIPAALQQHRYQPILKDPPAAIAIDHRRIGVVIFILAAAVGANILGTSLAPAVMAHIPVLGLAVWAAIIAAATVRRPDWQTAREAVPGTIFLLALVLSASLMPVEKLPEATWHTTFGLGFLSAVFDNIPLTALALRQGGYDWGALAFAVGFGGSMLWFGSTAGVAISNQYPEARSAVAWVKAAWYIPLAYVIGFAVLMATLGWRP